MWREKKRDMVVGKRNSGNIIRDQEEEQRKGTSWDLEKDLGYKAYLLVYMP